MAPSTTVAQPGSSPKAPEDAETAALEARLNPDRMPRHVAVIMDGNGRWAAKSGWRDRVRGHTAGIESVHATTRTARRLNIPYLTLYAFSKENWARPRAEVEALMRLLRRFLEEEIPELNENGIRLVATGEIEDLPGYAREQLARTEEATAQNDRMVLNLALSYGGRTEIVKAARRLAEKAAAGEIDPASIDASAFEQELYRPEIPDPDLMVRTSGEMRVSNFLLWQIAYAEIYITPVFWPDFKEKHFVEAILDYQQRDRRFGKVSSKPQIAEKATDQSSI